MMEKFTVTIKVDTSRFEKAMAEFKEGLFRLAIFRWPAWVVKVLLGGVLGSLTLFIGMFNG